MVSRISDDVLRHFKEASSIDFRRSVKYGLGCVATAIAFRLARLGLVRSAMFPPAGGPGR